MISRAVSRWLAGALLTLAAGLAVPLHAQVLDQVIFGNTASENANGFGSNNVSLPLTNPTTGDSFRYILPTPAGTVPLANGNYPPAGLLTFTLACDPVQTNYLTVKFWGSDTALATFYVYTNGVRLGVYGSGSIPELIFNQDAGLMNKYYYVTWLLPKAITSGKTSATLAIGASGDPEYYSAGEAMLLVNSPGVYGAYTSTNPFFTPVGETQGPGVARIPPTALNPVSALTNLQAALDAVVGVATNRQLYGSVWQGLMNNGVVPAALYGAMPNGSIATNAVSGTTNWLDLIANSTGTGNSSPMNAIEAYARAYTTSWSKYYHSTNILDRITAMLDYMCRAQGSDGGLGGGNDGDGWNGGPNRGIFGAHLEGYGTWALGEAFLLVQSNLTANGMLTNKMDANNTGIQDTVRGVAWANLFSNEVRYVSSPSGNGTAPNQYMAELSAMWTCNEAARALNANSAISSSNALVYAYQGCGLLPAQAGSHLAGAYLTSPKGLGLEQSGTGSGGYDFDYGGNNCLSKLNYLAQLTGDSNALARADKMIGALAPFMYPGQDATGAPIMQGESAICQRKVLWPSLEWCNVEYFQAAERTNLLARRAAQIAVSQGYFQPATQISTSSSIHYFPDAADEWRQIADIITTYNSVTNMPNLPLMPMEDAAPDFAWGDEIGNSVVVKDGSTKLFMQLNWRRNTGTPNNIARVHYVTAQYDVIGTIAMVESTAVNGG